MKTKSELQREVVQLLETLEVRELEVWGDLSRIKVLKEKARDMYERLDRGPGDRDTVELVGALHDEVLLDG